MREEARLMRREPAAWLAFGMGAGLSPWAPGTCGTLAAVPVFLLLRLPSWSWYLGAVAVLFLLGTWAAGRVVRCLERQDPQAVVVDEMVGYWVTMAPVAAWADWRWMLAGFALFRLFDIAKPWPIRQVDRELGGGLGTMLDDVLAGAFAAALMALAAWWLGFY